MPFFVFDKVILAFQENNDTIFYVLLYTSTTRKDAGVVDRAALEMRCTGNCTGGSNPSLSAEKIDYQSITEKAHSFTHTNVKTVRFLIGYFANNQ